MLYFLISVVVAGLTYISLQTEVAYFGTTASFYINMATHFLGGAFTAVGTLWIRSLINWCIRSGGFTPEGVVYKMYIPVLPIIPLIVIVLIVGTVWEVWEYYFSSSVILSVDTAKDVIMDMLGALSIGVLFGRLQHD